MLGARQPIIETDIRSIVQLSTQHRVFLVNGHQDDNVVIKKETSGLGANMRNVNRVMKAVDPRSRVKQLSTQEVDAIQNFVRGIALSNPQDAGMITAINQSFNIGTGFWSKMALMELTDAKQAMEAVENSQDKSGVRRIAAILNALHGIERLGEILAVDAFTGNRDRFFIDDWADQDTRVGANRQNSATMGFSNVTQFWHLINEGNLIVSLSSNARPVGLDAFDANSNFTDWNVELEDEYSQGTWPGHLLHNNNLDKRRIYCEHCVEDINVVLGERNRALPVFSKLRLQKNAPERLLNGMNLGITKIRQRLTAKYQNVAAPRGIRERFAALGWGEPQGGRVQWTSATTRSVPSAT